jgi:hypothetical protein
MNLRGYQNIFGGRFWGWFKGKLLLTMNLERNNWGHAETGETGCTWNIASRGIAMEVKPCRKSA